MAIRESALTAISVIGTTDYVRAVTADGASRNVLLSNLSRTVVENYASSTLGGQAQSIKEAIDNPVDSSVLSLYASLGWVNS